MHVVGREFACRRHLVHITRIMLRRSPDFASAEDVNEFVRAREEFGILEALLLQFFFLQFSFRIKYWMFKKLKKIENWTSDEELMLKCVKCLKCFEVKLVLRRCCCNTPLKQHQLNKPVMNVCIVWIPRFHCVVHFFTRVNYSLFRCP